jgi:subtilisin family serine protease
MKTKPRALEMNRWAAALGWSICAAATLAACSKGDLPGPAAAVVGGPVVAAAAAGIQAAGASPATAPVGVIVRLQGSPAFRAHALALGRGAGAARAAAVAQRAQLRQQHGRIIAALARKLGGLPARRAKGIVLGRSFDEFTDVLNAIALHDVDETAARALLKDDPDVVSIEPIRQVQANLPVSVPLIDADKVWSVPDSNGIAIDGTGIRIGILDTGVDYTHPDLGGCFGPGCKVVAGYDFVNNDADPMDDYGHGTHVAATAAGKGTYTGPNGPVPMPGVAPGAEIYAYKVLNANGFGSDDNIIAAIERCADPNGDGDPSDHLDVCSMSLGGSGDPDDAMSTAVDAAVASGVVFTIAAGNAGPAASTIGSPGTSRRAITVAAACKPASIGVDGNCAQPIAYFSSRGPVVWNAAGGVQTLAKPDVAAPGVSICAAEWGTYQSGARCLDGRHIALSGTSMATPHVAGVAALLRQAHPEWTPDQVKTFIVNSAHTFGLDPSAQGSGMVDALDALKLGGLPSQIALVGGTPLHDVDTPTTRFGTFSSNLTITNTTTSTLNFTGSFAGDAGLAVTLAPSSFAVGPGATVPVTVTRQVDHDVIASGVDARGTITFSSAQGNLQVGLEVGVRDRLTATPTPVDLGVDLASQSTWTGQATVQLTNLRTDAAQTYSAAVTCCVSAGQSAGASVVATVDHSSVSLAAGGTASLTVTVTVTNGPLASGSYLGSINLTSPLGALSVPLTFFKGYGLRIDAPTIPLALAVSSAQSGSTTTTPTAASTTFYSTTPGPFFVEAVWPYGLTWKHALATVNTDVPLAAASLDPSQAIYTFNVQPRDQNGQPFASALVMMYRFTHSASGGGIARSIGVGGPSGSPIYVSAVPAGVNFTAAAVGIAPDPIGYVYELAGPISSNQSFTNAGTDVIAKEVHLFAPGTGATPLVFVPTACLPWFPWISAPAGVPARPVQATCTQSSGATWPSGVGRMLFYNSSNRDLLAAPYPDAPAISYELHQGSISGATLANGPFLWVSATHPLTWQILAPWSGSVSLNGLYARFRCDEPPGNVLPVATAPLQDEWAWGNHMADTGFLGGYKGAFENPFVWGGCVQDRDYTTAPVSYSLARDGVVVQSATMASNQPIFPSLADGQYRLQMTRSPTIAGLTATVDTVSTFQVSSSMSIDENPPALHGVHLLGRELWQPLLDPAVVDRLHFTVDPMPGYGGYNPNGPPPVYTPLADGLAQVTLQQSTDGVAWKGVPVTALGNGDYETDTLDVDPTAPLTSFRIFATDLAGNSLQATFQIPRGASYAPSGADVTPPTTSITSPSNGALLTGLAAVTAAASDNVGVTAVDLLLDGVRIGRATAAPYTFSVDTSIVVAGSHVLQARAQDAAENVAYSAPVSVTTQNADSTPPTVAFAAPDAGALLRGTVTVTATASDNAAVARVELYDGATLLGAPTTAPYAVSWATGAGPDGVRTLKAVAYDAAGNAAQATLVVSVDNTPPTAIWTAPADGSNVSGVVSLTAAVADNVGIARVEYWINDYSILGTATSSPWALLYDLGVYSGALHLRARAYDTAGNMGQSALVTVTVVPDTTPPTVAITSPVEGAILGKYNNVSIAATDDKSGISSLELDDGTNVVFSGLVAAPYVVSYDTTLLPDGPHTLTAQARDGNFNVGVSAPVHVTVDKVPPIAAVTAPASNAHVAGVVTIQATASDAVALDTVGLQVDDTTLVTLTAGPYATSWNTVTWAPGWHSVSARATDKGANQTLATIFVFVDNSVTPTISAPAAGSLVGKTVTLTATTNNDAAVASLTFLDGATSIGTVTAPPFTVTWNPASAGAHSLTARVTDQQGNVTTSAAVAVTADIVAPTVSLTAPASGATVSGAVNVTATATDNTAVARVELYDGTSLFATVTGAPYTAAWNTGTVTPGAHTLKARAYDTAGNATDSAPVSVTVTSDATPPTVSLTAPSNGAIITGTVVWSATASDNVGVTRVEFRDGSTVVTTLTASPYSFNWNTASAATGAHTLTARAYDAAGNSATSASRSVTIDRTAPTVALSAPASGATVSGTVTVSATASDSNGIGRVEFYRDGSTLIATDSSSPYSVSWDTTTTAAGSHALTARAFDVAGNATTSASRSVTVKDVTAPAVSLTSPANASRVAVGSTVTIAATATDATGVTKVEFSVNNVLTCTDTTAAYTCAWKVPSGANKSYTLVAKAYDAAGNTRTATVSVTSM